MDTDLQDIHESEPVNEEGDIGSGKSRKSIKSKSPLFYLFDILMTGFPGWRRLVRARISPEQSAAGCFYPIAALAAVCRFADWIYAPMFILSDTLVNAVGIFMSFFFSYFAVQVVCKWTFPATAVSRTELPFFKQMVQYALASLALFWIPAELVPILEPVTVFLPIWTAFILTKAMKILRIPDKMQTRCTATVVIATIGMPYLILWLAEKIL